MMRLSKTLVVCGGVVLATQLSGVAAAVSGLRKMQTVEVDTNSGQKSGLKCVNQQIKADKGETVCLKEGEAICIDYDQINKADGDEIDTWAEIANEAALEEVENKANGGKNKNQPKNGYKNYTAKGKWKFGIIDKKLVLLGPHNELVWEFCDYVTKICIGENEHGKNPYLKIKQGEDIIAKLTCNNYPKPNDSNNIEKDTILKDTILKMVDNSSIEWANHPLTIVKGRKGDLEPFFLLYDPKNPQYLHWDSTEKLPGFMTYDTNNCSWEDQCPSNAPSAVPSASPTKSPTPKPSSKPSGAPSVYSGCIVETDITCTLADGSGTSCEEGFPPISVDDCGLVPVEYCYTIENTGPTCGVVTTFERTVNGITLDLLEGKPEVRLCTGEELEVCETIDINTCVETPDCYESEVTAALKMADGSVCEDEDTYSFCVPPASSESCNVEVAVGCSTEANKTEDGSGNCDVIIPIATRCDSRAAAMTWRFNGGNCEQSFNIQEADKFVCTDFVEGGGPTEGEAYITVASVKDPTDIYFNGPVGVGELFSMFAANSMAGKFDNDSFFYVYADSSKSQLLQLSSVDTSCSQNLFLKDKFGSVQLLIFENEFGLFTPFVQGTYAFTITNQGSTESGEIVEFTSTTNGITDDCLDAVPEPKTVAPGDTLAVDKIVLLDMTVRQTYDTEVYVKAQTPGGAVCDDTASLSFESGNPTIPTFERK